MSWLREYIADLFLRSVKLPRASADDIDAFVDADRIPLDAKLVGHKPDCVIIDDPLLDRPARGKPAPDVLQTSPHELTKE